MDISRRLPESPLDISRRLPKSPPSLSLDVITIYITLEPSQSNPTLVCLQHRRDIMSLKSLVRIASSSNGFACGATFGRKSKSPYHDRDTLFDFEIQSYLGETTNAGGVPFSGSYNTLGEFYNSLNARPSSPGLVVQVCYGGVFAASTENIFKQDMSVWKTVENALERGDSIQEGHFMERIWGVLLATHLEAFQIEALRFHSTEVRIAHGNSHGHLLRYEDEDDDEEEDKDD
jgi:hypothetical protein